MTKQVEIYYVTGLEIRHVMSQLMNQGTYFIAGPHSIYVPAGKRKYVDKSVCRDWPDLENQIRLMTPGEAVRTELMREWPDLKKVGWVGPMVNLFDVRSPMVYCGPHVGKMIYIDLDGAYSQIYEKLWLDTNYPRAYYGRFPLWDVAQRLKIWKGARNSLIGIVRSREGVAYRGRKRISLKFKNKYLSPGLWATVQAVLHMVMSKALDCGAIYGNVDGFIFPYTDWAGADEFTFWLASSGFRWSVRAQGEGEIVSWNNYRIGEIATKANKLGLIHKSKGFSNVNTKNQGRWARYWDGLGKIAEANELETGERDGR